ncbi:MAG: lysophospholipid acyltransferase family protein [Vicinamibacterales bacterium]
MCALGVLVPPLWIRLSFTRGDRDAYRLVQACARRVVALAGCSVRVTGLEHLPASGHVMLVANHASMADAALLLAALPVDFRFVANHVSAGYPMLGAAIRRASYHIVDRGSWRGRAECAQSMIDALESGQSLLVFPEGRTGEAGRMLPFRNGAFRAAARRGTPVVPIVIRGTRDLMAPGRRLLVRAPVDIDVLRPRVAIDATRASVVALRDETARAIADRLAMADRPSRVDRIASVERR